MLYSKKSILNLTTAIILVIIILTCFSSCGISKKHEMAVEYMEQYGHNENIVYVDNENIYFAQKTVNYRECLAEYDVTSILYISFDSIYFCSTDKNQVNVYACDYNLEDIKKIHTFVKKYDILDVSMVSDNEIWYVDENGKNIYNVEEQKTQIVDDFPILEKTFSISVSKRDDIEIKNIETGEMKVIQMAQLLEFQQAKNLSEITGYFDVDCLIEKNDKIYINCLSNFIVTTYVYDFNTNELEFVDWSEAYGSVRVFFLYC